MNPNFPQKNQQSALSPVSVETSVTHESEYELPPSARQGTEVMRDRLPGSRGSSGRWKFLGGLIGAVAAITIGIVSLGSLGNEERKSSNWENVQAATQSGHAMHWIAAGGIAAFSDAIVVGDEDEDVKTTAAIREAIGRGDFASADALFAAAQSIQMTPTEPSASNGPAPDLSPDHDVANSSVIADPSSPAGSDVSGVEIAANPITPQRYQPKLTSGLRSEIATGDAKFFHIHLSDSCRNDGDVVEILLNGHPAFLVPITNAGSTLSVPVTSGTAMVISVRGVYDGGGGITVACRTSKGEGFVRVMAPGEIQPLGVVFQ